MTQWTITYDDGEDFRQETASGKLSLDPAWAFIIDSQRANPNIVLAVPSSRIIDIKEA
jgi:hypothetical protein